MGCRVSLNSKKEHRESVEAAEAQNEAHMIFGCTMDIYQPVSTKRVYMYVECNVFTNNTHGDEILILNVSFKQTTSMVMRY